MDEGQKTVRGTVFPTTQLASGLREWEVSEFIKDDEVEPHQMFCKPARPSSTGLGLQPVHQIDDIEEPAPGTIADDRARDGHGDMGLAGPRAANQHDIALLAEDRAMDSATGSRNHGEARWPDRAPGSR